jgi:glycerol-3-phosphate O-acyltransferase
MGEADLLAQIALSQTLLARSAVLRPRHRHPAHAGADRRPRRGDRHAARTKHPLGDVLSVDDDTAVLLSYFRNNVLHLFTARRGSPAASRTTGA